MCYYFTFFSLDYEFSDDLDSNQNLASLSNQSEPKRITIASPPRTQSFQMSSSIPEMIKRPAHFEEIERLEEKLRISEMKHEKEMKALKLVIEELKERLNKLENAG